MGIRGNTNIDKMKDEAAPSFMNSFIAGLKTEYTGLNFPPDAATETDNCVFTMIGDVTRRKGFDYEDYHALSSLGDRNEAGLNTYVWKNAGGDGESILFVTQVGTTLNFFVVTDTSLASPLSQHKIASSVDLSAFAVSGSPRDVECTFADGNGYLFVYNNACNPIYCTYDPIGETVTANAITVEIRDFIGVTAESTIDPTKRLQTLSTDHEYNLRNQGWTRAPLWTVTPTDNAYEYNKMGDGSETIPKSFTGNGVLGMGVVIGDHPYTVATGLPISPGTPVDIQYTIPVWIYDIQAISWTTGNATGKANGVVKAYDPNGGGIVISITYTQPDLSAPNLEIGANPGGGGVLGPVQYTINSSKSINTIDTFFSQIGLYPSNADIWWIFKDETDVFNPAVTIGSKGLPSAWAPKGHFVLDAFSQNRTGVTTEANSYASPIPGLTNIVTSKRPTNGTWFQGRVWYAGVDDSQQAVGDQSFYTWTENIYFSRIIESVGDFGKCHEDNDPTDQYSFNLLPSDGGVITIQGAGAIFKLFPIQNGMLVFAANGVWFITGSQGIGFSATDYTITKISAVRSISSNSYVDVNGLPIFWNEEGIYAVAPAQQGLGIQVTPLTVNTIKSFYDEIPLSSKTVARGSYNPIDYIVQWLYKDTSSSTTLSMSEQFQSDTLKAGATTTKRIWLYDDSGHQYTSNNLGASWLHRETPGDFTWTDQSLAYIDGDFSSTVAVNDHTQFSLSSDGGLNWTVHDLDNAFGGTWNTAISANADKILFTTTGDYLHMSTDRGLTSPSIAINLGMRDWGSCCFNAGASVMYATSKDNYIAKSSDGGQTWHDLTTGPKELHVTSEEEIGDRIRCSGDGNTVIYICGYTGNVFISRDGGTSWTQVYTGGSLGDCGISYDGTTMIFTSLITAGTDVIKISRDYGATWNDYNPNGFKALGLRPRTCNVSQDGSSFVVGYKVAGGLRYVSSSFDVGDNWTLSSVPGDTFEWVNSFIYDVTFDSSSTSSTITTGGSVTFPGYVVIPGAPDFTTTGNSASKEDSLGIYNFRAELSQAPNKIQQWTIPGNVQAQYGFNPNAGGHPLAGLVSVHALPNNLVATRGDDANGEGTANGLYIFDTSGNLVHNIADSFTGGVVMLNNMMDDYNGTLVGIASGGAFGKTQMWRCNYATDTSLTQSMVVDTGAWDFNSFAIGPTYAYSFRADSGDAFGYTKVRMFNWHTLGTFTDIDLSSICATGKKMTNIAYDRTHGKVVIVMSDGTIYLYNEAVTTQLGASAAGLINTTGFNTVLVDQNSSKRMCANGYLRIATAFTHAPGYMLLHKIDLSSLTIVEALRSDAVVNGFRIAVFPYEAATWIIWNEQMSGFYLTHHFGDWQFYPVTPPAITAVVTVSSNPYEFNRVLNYNTHTGAFYPWTLSTDPVNGVTSPRVHAVDYIQGPGGTNDPPAIFKYFTSVLNSDGTYSYTFSEESDPSYVDWDYATETTGDVYNSYFTTGYSLFGQGLRQFQPVYVEMFSRLNEPNMKYSIQGLWNFATNGNSGKWSTRQVTSLDKPNYGMAYRRHKIRGIGYALQLKISSVGNSPFDIMGWSMQITQNAGV